MFFLWRGVVLSYVLYRYVLHTNSGHVIELARVRLFPNIEMSHAHWVARALLSFNEWGRHIFKYFVSKKVTNS